MCERVLVIVLRRKGEFVGIDGISTMEITVIGGRFCHVEFGNS